MAVETAKDKIKLSQIVGQKQEIISIDGDVIVNDVKPDVLKVISTNGTICVYKKEVLNGKVKFEGCINTYIIYLADDEENNIRTINTSLDFAEIIDLENCKEGMTVEDILCLKGFETKVLNGRKLHVKAFVELTLKAYSNTDVEAIVDITSDGEDIQMLNGSKKVLSLIAENTGKTTLKDTINLNTGDELAEIMKVTFSLTDVQTKISYNKVLIKANANVSVMYLTEDNRINETNGLIPLMGFIDMPNITDTAECTSRIALKNLVIRQNSGEENSLDVEADVELSCRAYESKEINLIEDAYSIENDIKLKRMEVRARAKEFKLKESFTVSEKLQEPELMYGRILGVGITPNLDEVNVEDGKIKYKGKLNAEIIASSENDVTTVNKEIPFNFELSSGDINSESNVDTQINVVSQRVINADDGWVLEVELEVNANIQNDETINFAQDIDVLEPQNMESYSMVIYFVKPGDTLWKIAKQFKSTVEDIARVNEIEDTDKIFPGQQLYIPKFTRSRISI